jgi:hypothetical protein
MPEPRRFMSKKIIPVSGGYEIVGEEKIIHANQLTPFGKEKSLGSESSIGVNLKESTGRDYFRVFREHSSVLEKRAQTYADDMKSDFYEVDISGGGNHPGGVILSSYRNATVWTNCKVQLYVWNIGCEGKSSH